MALFAQAGGIAEPDRGHAARSCGRHAIGDKVFLRLCPMEGHLFFEFVVESSTANEKSEFFAKARKPVHAGLLAIAGAIVVDHSERKAFIGSVAVARTAGI